jgi:hypothetical protein
MLILGIESLGDDLLEGGIIVTPPVAAAFDGCELFCAHPAQMSSAGIKKARKQVERTILFLIPDYNL